MKKNAILFLWLAAFTCVVSAAFAKSRATGKGSTGSKMARVKPGRGTKKAPRTKKEFKLGVSGKTKKPYYKNVKPRVRKKTKTNSKQKTEKKSKKKLQTYR